MAIKKPLYVRKSDFLNYFDRPEDLWFLDNEEIEGIFRSYLKKNKKKTNVKNKDNEDFETDEDFDVEFIEFDALDFYRESLILKTTDNDDPKFIEGNLIAEQAKQFLVNYCQKNLKINNVVDFNEVYQGDPLNLRDRANFSKTTIVANSKPTLFLNPLFIANDCVVIPNAVIYNNHCYELIDVKSVTALKRYHILDLYYQIAIIKENLKELKNAWIALIAYERKNKNTVSFTITNLIRETKSTALDFTTTLAKYLNYFNGERDLDAVYQKIIDKNKDDLFIKNNSKSILRNYANLYKQFQSFLKINNTKKTNSTHSLNVKKFYKQLPFYSSDLISLKQHWKKYGTINTDFLINPDYQKNDAIDKKKSKKEEKNEFLSQLKIVTDNFWNVVKQIAKHEVPKVLDFPVSNKYKTFWRDFKYLASIRKVFEIKGYDFFGYSGKLIPWEKAINYLQINESSLKDKTKTWKLEDFISKPEKKSNNKTEKKPKLAEIYLNVYQKTLNKNLKYSISSKALINFKKLKKCKVYFDFETINQAIRVIDNSLPFMQVITQCSILKDHGKGIEENCLNLIVDPKNITNDFFKQIIDALYESNFNDYSYVVYNASFERNRLIELKAILDDTEYSKKIDRIIANLYDLADFFLLSNNQIIMVDLKGFHSIKIILKLIPKPILKATKTVDYSLLDIRKGDKAQAITSLRFFNQVSDDKWKLISQQLQKYCENDVRAMVAVERFIKQLIEAKIS